MHVTLLDAWKALNLLMGIDLDALVRQIVDDERERRAREGLVDEPNEPSCSTCRSVPHRTCRGGGTGRRTGPRNCAARAITSDHDPSQAASDGRFAICRAFHDSRLARVWAHD
jgi:hypothetical protein